MNPDHGYQQLAADLPTAAVDAREVNPGASPPAPHMAWSPGAPSSWAPISTIRRRTTSTA